MTNPIWTWRDDILDAMPNATPAIGELTGAHRNVVNRWITRLHAAGEIHITGWLRWRGGPLPIYTVGPGVDAPCTLKPYSPMQNYNRFKRRARSDGRWEDAKAKSRARAAAKRASEKGFAADPLLGAFFPKRAEPC